MLKLKQKIAVMEGEQANARDAVLRITGCFANHEVRMVKVFLDIGFISTDGQFVIANPQKIELNIMDLPERREPIMQEDGRTQFVELPAQFLYTLLVTPLDNHRHRWAGDFRLKDIEEMIIRENLLPQFQVDGIIEQK